MEECGVEDKRRYKVIDDGDTLEAVCFSPLAAEASTTVGVSVAPHHAANPSIIYGFCPSTAQSATTPLGLIFGVSLDIMTD